MVFTPGQWTVSPRLALHGSLGRSEGGAWTRGVASAGIVVEYGRLGVRGDASYGAVSRDAAERERFSLGGTMPPLFDPALLSQRVFMPALPAGVAGGSRFASYRITLPGEGVRPYFWSASAGAELRRWHHVVGLEWTQRFEGLWPVALPDAWFSCGVGYSLSEPLRHETRGYLSLSYRP